MHGKNPRHLKYSYTINDVPAIEGKIYGPYAALEQNAQYLSIAVPPLQDFQDFSKTKLSKNFQNPRG